MENLILESEPVRRLFNQPNIVIRAINDNHRREAEPTAVKPLQNGWDNNKFTLANHPELSIRVVNKKVSKTDHLLPSKFNGKSNVELVPIEQRLKQCGHYVTEFCEDLICEVEIQYFEDEIGTCPIIAFDLDDDELCGPVEKHCENFKCDALSIDHNRCRAALIKLHKFDKSSICDICEVKFDSPITRANHNQCRQKHVYRHNNMTPAELFRLRMREREIQITAESKKRKSDRYLDPVDGYNHTLRSLNSNRELIVIPKALPRPSINYFNGFRRDYENYSPTPPKQIKLTTEHLNGGVVNVIEKPYKHNYQPQFEENYANNLPLKTMPIARLESEPSVLHKQKGVPKFCIVPGAYNKEKPLKENLSNNKNEEEKKSKKSFPKIQLKKSFGTTNNRSLDLKLKIAKTIVKKNKKNKLMKRKFVCPHCQKRFSSADYCKLHILKHEKKISKSTSKVDKASVIDEQNIVQPSPSKVQTIRNNIEESLSPKTAPNHNSNQPCPKEEERCIEPMVEEKEELSVPKIMEPKIEPNNRINTDCIARSRSSRRSSKHSQNYKCAVCERTFDNETQYEIHEANNPRKVGPCLNCGKNFHRKAEITEHMKTCTVKIINKSVAKSETSTCLSNKNFEAESLSKNEGKKSVTGKNEIISPTKNLHSEVINGSRNEFRNKPRSLRDILPSDSALKKEIEIDQDNQAINGYKSKKKLLDFPEVETKSNLNFQIAKSKSLYKEIRNNFQKLHKKAIPAFDKRKKIQFQKKLQSIKEELCNFANSKKLNSRLLSLSKRAAKIEMEQESQKKLNKIRVPNYIKKFKETKKEHETLNLNELMNGSCEEEMTEKSITKSLDCHNNLNNSSTINEKTDNSTSLTIAANTYSSDKINMSLNNLEMVNNKSNLEEKKNLNNVETGKNMDHSERIKKLDNVEVDKTMKKLEQWKNFNNVKTVKSVVNLDEKKNLDNVNTARIINKLDERKNMNNVETVKNMVNPDERKIMDNVKIDKAMQKLDETKNLSNVETDKTKQNLVERKNLNNIVCGKIVGISTQKIQDLNNTEIVKSCSTQEKKINEISHIVKCPKLNYSEKEDKKSGSACDPRLNPAKNYLRDICRLIHNYSSSEKSEVKKIPQKINSLTEIDKIHNYSKKIHAWKYSNYDSNDHNFSNSDDEGIDCSDVETEVICTELVENKFQDFNDVCRLYNIKHCKYDANLRDKNSSAIETEIILDKAFEDLLNETDKLDSLSLNLVVDGLQVEVSSDIFGENANEIVIKPSDELMNKKTNNFVRKENISIPVYYGDHDY